MPTRRDSLPRLGETTKTITVPVTCRLQPRLDAIAMPRSYTATIVQSHLNADKRWGTKPMPAKSRAEGSVYPYLRLVAVLLGLSGALGPPNTGTSASPMGPCARVIVYGGPFVCFRPSQERRAEKRVNFRTIRPDDIVGRYAGLHLEAIVLYGIYPDSPKGKRAGAINYLFGKGGEANGFPV